MSYKFKVSETFAEGLGRIAAEQIERVRACLLPGTGRAQGGARGAQIPQAPAGPAGALPGGHRRRGLSPTSTTVSGISREGCREHARSRACWIVLLHLETPVRALGAQSPPGGLAWAARGERGATLPPMGRLPASRWRLRQALAEAGKQLAALQLRAGRFRGDPSRSRKDLSCGATLAQAGLRRRFRRELPRMAQGPAAALAAHATVDAGLAA